MKLITLNFGTWSSFSAKSGILKRIYKRVYIKGYKWTPLVIAEFKINYKNKQIWKN